MAGEVRAIFGFPVGPVFVAREDGVDHAVVEFAFGPGLEVGCYVLFCFLGPLRLFDGRAG